MATHNMNRKRTSKIKHELAKQSAREHPFDRLNNWIRGDYATPPWPKDKIADFQKRINSAFGAENALVLVWSADRSYGDEICDGPWDSFGNPIGKFNRKPVLLFGQYGDSGGDFLYVVPPRWCVMEVHHGSQLTDWDEAAWVSDTAYIGSRKRIRPEKAPEFYYVHLINSVLASHEQPLVSGGEPPCCTRLWENAKRICYGKYREPNDSDIAMIRSIREGMDAWGVAQRADQPRSAKMLMLANLATTHFMREAKLNRSRAAKDLILSNVGAFCGDILKKKGSTMPLSQMERIVTQALNDDEEARFSKEQL